MNRPYIICHMMSSVDGRIDCAMTEKLPGVEEYYSTLGELNAATTLSGKTTAKLELAESGEFKPSSAEKLCKEAFSKKADARGYEVITDTKGTLLWQDEAEKPRVVITSEQVSKDYIDYLDGKNISWIACGKSGIDLAHACEILFDEFGVRRMAIVGGGRINAGFLDAGLLDEVSLVIGAGIDGRAGQPAVFDGLPADKDVYRLKLKGVKTYESGAVWIRYMVR